MNDLEKLSDANRLLAQVKDASSAKKIMDMASAAKHYATKAKLGKEAIDYAHAIKTDAERLLGQYLEKAPKATGGQPYQSTGTKAEPVDTPTLASLGLTKKQSAESQQLAKIAEKAPEEYEEIRANKKTVTAVRRDLKRSEVAEAAPLPDAKYRIVYADPPWKYGDQLTESYGAAKYHYPSMSISELCLLPVADMAEDNAVLFLWVTSPMLEEAFQVIRAWGFKYKTSFVWDKIKHNMGHYNSVRHEFLLVCTRGSCTPDNPKLYDSVVSVERTEHSAKPEEFRRIIDDIYKTGRRVELFARAAADGWDRWGNQA